MENKNTQLYVAFFAFIILGISTSILNIAWAYMEDSFQVTLDSLRVLLSMITVGYLSSSFISGRLVASIGIGKLLLLGAGMAILGVFGYAIAPFWELLLIAAMFASFGSGLIDAGLNTYMSANHSTSEMNWLHACFGIGATIGPLLVSFVVITLDQSWRLSYVALLVFEMIVLIMFWLNLPHWKLYNGESSNQEGSSSGEVRPARIMETLRTPLVILGALLFFLYGGVEIGTAQLANSLLVDGRNVSEATASFWVSMYWGTFTIGRMLSGVFASRFSINSLMRSSMIGVVIGALLFWLNIGGKSGFLGLIVLGFTQAPFFATLTSDTPRRVGLRHAPNTIGFQLGMIMLGGALLPGLAASLADRAGLEVIGLIITISAVSLLLLYEFMLYRETRTKRKKAMVSAGD